MIRDDATQAQVDAADPYASTWLSANAGSGKTRVLTDRVARLLFEDVEPQNILCLTYTKAAAAEMQNRLFERLGKWAMMPDGMLQDDLTDLGVSGTIDAARLRNARQLFARAIETPGGLKIQTIHSFCSGVLRRFPLEVEISPQFKEIEDTTARELRADVVDRMVEGPDGHVVADLLRHFTGADLTDLTAEIARKRAQFLAPLTDDSLRAALGLPANLKRADLPSLAIDGSESGLIEEIAQCFSGQSKTYVDFAKALQALNIKTPDWAAYKTVGKMFLYANSAQSKSVNFPQSNHKKAVEAAEPFIDDLHGWMDRVAIVKNHEWALDAADKTRALYVFAQVFLPAYEAAKLAKGMLDFDDLIGKTKQLLTDRDVAQWVLFRLDGGIDHLLVDEAQDTSPTQWAVVRQLTQEFTAGDGAKKDADRTIFVVGDRKQSIYSFQGAAPEAFDEMRHHFDNALSNVGRQLMNRSLDYSFRSSFAILRVVDQTFSGPQSFGMETGAGHLAFKEDMPGRVDLWPVEEKVKDDDDRKWFEPVDMRSATDEKVVLAAKVAAHIRHMVDHETLPVEIGRSGTYNHRPITEGDVLILVRGRKTGLFDEIIRACKAADLQIAGADRLRVGAELAVRDLAALLAFVALPEDDLSLAAALRSPLFGWSEQDLFTLAHHRPEKGFLWTAIRETQDGTPSKAILDDLRGKADFMRPYDLIERILTRHDGRRKLLARLGNEAEDGIDALLSQALNYESLGVPSLTGFLAAMETDDLEVKRQMDSQSDRIRVMTVHGAKGLEAPIVFLPDSAKKKNSVRDDLLPTGDHVIWKTASDSSAENVAALSTKIADAQSEENKRLLYVAMTRAEKWLIVAAAGDVGDVVEDSWYNMVADAMTHSGAAKDQSGDISVQRLTHERWQSGDLETKAAETVSIATPVQLDPLPELAASRTLSPSDLGGPKVLSEDSGELDEDDAKMRGTAIHLLLEHLPNRSIADRPKIAAALLAGLDAGSIAADVPDVVDGILTAAHLSHLWTSDALAEVDFTAQVGPYRFHGTIDRLLVTDTHVLAVDYKSNHNVPTTADQTPEGLLRQMGAYHASLAAIFPDHTINVAILWTKNAQLMTLPNELVLDALNRVTAA
ncbi:MAG: double-strand break repair helicase AddA [Yoonia sp.]|nr:double-strand break repair helicase AddA [Yoonia sp.]